MAVEPPHTHPAPADACPANPAAVDPRPLVSVVVPVYKVERYLERCLDSLIAQDYRPIEIIVVDDGSPDRCPAIIDRYAERHRLVRALHTPHRGLGPARNTGVRAARGSYVAYVDSDDHVEPDYVRTLVELAEAHGADIAIASFTFEILGLKIAFPFRRIPSALTGADAARASLDMLRFPSFAWSKLYRRELLTDRGIPFPAIYYEDVATTPRVLMTATTVAATRRRIYHYCFRRDSITGDFGLKNIASYLRAVRILRDFLSGAGLWEDWAPGYRALLRTARLLLVGQIVAQPNRIPWRARPAAIRWLLGSLRRLSAAPTQAR